MSQIFSEKLNKKLILTYKEYNQFLIQIESI